MKNLNRDKLFNVVVTVLVLLEVIFVHLTFKSLENKPTELYDVKLRDEIKEYNKSFALMIEQEDGSYSTTISDTWPTDKTFNKELSGCLDSNGLKIKDSINYDYVNKTAIITAGETTYCYLYFDIDKTFVIYSETDNSLRFYNNDDYNTVEVGDTYNELIVTAKYNGVENTNYQQSGETVNAPWFEYANEITSVHVEGKLNPNNIAHWFNRLKNVFYLDLTNLDVSNVTSMYGTFGYTGYNVDNFKIDGLSNWDTSNVTNMSYMFETAGYNAENWSVGDLSNWDTSKVTSMQDMFSYAGYSTTIFDIGNLFNWNTSKVTNMSFMFEYTGLNADKFKLDLSNWDTSNVTTMQAMFYYAGKETSEWSVGNLSNWDTSKVTNMGLMFSYTGSKATEWNIGTLANWDTSKVTNMAFMFEHAGLTAEKFTLDLSKWNTSKVTAMQAMFYYAGQEVSEWSVGDLSNWDTSNVITMNHMFSYTGSKAAEWNIGTLANWDTSKVTNMSFMFEHAGLNADKFTLDLSKWNTSNVTTMQTMFYYAGKEASEWSVGDISGWDTSKVISMNFMFDNAGLNATYTLDLSGWQVPLVTSYRNFNVGVTSKITQPLWVN